MMRITTLFVGLLIGGCSSVDATHPLDPSSPPSSQHRSRLEGTVVLPAGEDAAALVSARVTLFSAERGGAQIDQKKLVEGGFAFEAVLPGQYRLRVTAPGFETQVRYVVLQLGESLDIGEVFLEVPEGTLTGRALREDGDEQGHGGIVVRVEDTGITAVTAPDGQYVLQLRAGDVDLVYSADGYSSQTTEGNVIEAAGILEVDDITLEPRNGSLVGNVGLRRFENAQRLDSVSVALNPNAGTLEEPTGTGDFTFSDVPPGDYTLSLSLEGYDTETRRITLSAAQELEVGLIELSHESTGPSRVVFEGRVVLLGDDARGGVAVEAFVVTPESNDELAVIVNTDFSGNFRFDASPKERYRLRASRVDYETLTAGPFSYNDQTLTFASADGGAVILQMQSSQ